MGCLGVHFAIDAADLAALRAVSERERPDYVAETIEERYMAGDKRYAAESDKTWDAMHRVLSDGTMTWDGGTYPLNHTVLGGELLYTRDDYIMSLKTPAQVREIANALETLTEASFRRLYDAIDPDDYDGEIGDEDFGATWGWFTNVRDLYRRAAQEGRYVLFTADQ
jgi:hypothetical protein